MMMEVEDDPADKGTIRVLEDSLKVSTQEMINTPSTAKAHGKSF